jgi:uncharacterized membrane protein YgcG
MSAQPKWDDTGQPPRPAEVRSHHVEAASERNAALILVVAALSSIAAGSIHVAAASTLGDGNTQTFAFFGVAAAAEIVWGLVALARAPRRWLVLGALGNAAVVITWIVSRTVGLPVGEFAHEVLPVGYADVLATVFGAVTVVAAGLLAIRGSDPERAVARVRGFALAAAIVIGVLALSGVISQANASSGGGGGQNGPTAPAGGGAYGGNSGGTGTSSGGYGGY